MAITAEFGGIVCQQMHVCIPWCNHDRFYDSSSRQYCFPTV